MRHSWWKSCWWVSAKLQSVRSHRGAATLLRRGKLKSHSCEVGYWSWLPLLNAQCLENDYLGKERPSLSLVFMNSDYFVCYNTVIQVWSFIKMSSLQSTDTCFPTRIKVWEEGSQTIHFLSRCFVAQNYSYCESVQLVVIFNDQSIFNSQLWF